METIFQNEDIVFNTIGNKPKLFDNVKKRKSVYQEESRVRILWVRFTKLITILIPEKLIPGFSGQAKMAWREKVALCVLIGALSISLLSYLVILPSRLCPACRIMSLDEVSEKPNYNPHVIIHGKIYDLTGLTQRHVQNTAIPHHIFDFAGKDASKLFPRPIMIQSINDDRKLNLKDDNDSSFEPYFHSWQDLQIATNWSQAYDLCFSWEIVSQASTSDTAWIVINGLIFDIASLKREIDLSIKSASLNEDIRNVIENENFIKLISAPWGRDKSNQFRYDDSHHHFDILLKGYQIGVIDYRDSFQCKMSNILMIGSTAIVVMVILVKFFASLQLGIKMEPEKLNRHVVVLVPCYSEDYESLKRTIDSISDLDYDKRKKVMFIISDGIVTGRGSTASTPDLLKRILGITSDSQPYFYHSVSSEANLLNRAELYFGEYTDEKGEIQFPFVLVVKIGCPEEAYQAGNRGKRDSQLILLKFLSKFYYDIPMTPLELELCRGLKYELNIDPSILEFVLMIDADTEIFSDALIRLLACCIHDSKIIGICGETRIKNEKTSWITMIQVYEYFISHHMSKAFESIFGCVTCLPGCFCMYRLKNVTENTPLLISRDLVHEYAQSGLKTLHQRNLLSLGEDRFLTTLALKYFPKYRTKFTSDAVCRTIVPEKWTVLLSQRRRWINSTIHNLFELLLLPNLCGFCMFSMRFIIFMDLFSTIILPATIVYMIFLGIQSFEEHVTAKISIFMICSVYGLQVLIFCLKRQWQHIGWMFLYLFAIPLFGFFIPLYSFWHFDDFSWGNTRLIQKSNEYDTEAAESTTSVSHPMVYKTWGEYIDESKFGVS